LSSVVSIPELEPSSLVIFTFLSYMDGVCRMRVILICSCRVRTYRKELVSICFSTSIKVFSASIKVFSNHSNSLAYLSKSSLGSCMKGLNLNLSLSLFMTPLGSYYHIKLLLKFICCNIFSTSFPASQLAFDLELSFLPS